MRLGGAWSQVWEVMVGAVSGTVGGRGYGLGLGSGKTWMLPSTPSKAVSQEHNSPCKVQATKGTEM